MRIIGRLDIKGPNLIKGINLEGLRIVGHPNKYAVKYFNDGIDELIFMDSVASLYNRNNLSNIIKIASKDIFIPITVGGGIRSVDDAHKLFISGADKIAINTAAVNNPSLILDLSREFGSQAVVLSIEAKKIGKCKWEAFTNNGREQTGLDVVEWAKNGIAKGAGEILLTSVDMEGTRRGFDYELIEQVSKISSVPVIASGGFGEPLHMVQAIKHSGADAIAIADSLHYNRFSLRQIRDEAINAKIKVRKFN
jgi:cyclase